MVFFDFYIILVYIYIIKNVFTYLGYSVILYALTLTLIPVRGVYGIVGMIEHGEYIIMCILSE